MVAKDIQGSMRTRQYMCMGTLRVSFTEHTDSAQSSLAVEHALETTSLNNPTLRVSRPTVSSSQNPYILPFAMRGVLEEDYVRTELQAETTELLKQFDDWKPSSKVLKDVKFRLEGVRSKL